MASKRITCAYCGNRRIAVKGYREERFFKYKLTNLYIVLERWSMCNKCQDKVFKLMANAANYILNGEMPRSCFNRTKKGKCKQ